MPTNIFNKTLSEDNNDNDVRNKTTYKLIKVFTSINWENREHQQLFFNITNSTNTSTLTPVYCREVIRSKQQNLYWYNAALKKVPRQNSSQSDNGNNSTNESSLPVTIWAIHPAKLKISKVLKLIKRRPKKFKISCTQTGIQSSFEYGREKNEPLGYSGEINVPFDEYCIQRFRWVRYGDGSKWVFIFKNDPRTPLAEFRRTSVENEFKIVFLEDAPPGWNSKTVERSNGPGSPTFPSPSYPSGFTVDSFSPSILSQYSGYSEPTWSKESNKYLSGSISLMSAPMSLMSLSSPLNSTYSTTDDFFYHYDDNSLNTLWQEYVLASTVAIQDEVNSRKNRLRK
ncbi:6283_t:CDS:2 [Diversispora eburnea]|uniref:6283_t:CDS:1 n=1 Tax=Diversispora eburnea TaxID=1213867 RepID=A0A9N8YMF3_9GLOM|nr:6283_t:CDS:2 [Diversispora eburnea]